MPLPFDAASASCTQANAIIEQTAIIAVGMRFIYLIPPLLLLAYGFRRSSREVLHSHRHRRWNAPKNYSLYNPMSRFVKQSIVRIRRRRASALCLTISKLPFMEAL